MGAEGFKRAARHVAIGHADSIADGIGALVLVAAEAEQRDLGKIGGHSHRVGGGRGDRRRVAPESQTDRVKVGNPGARPE